MRDGYVVCDGCGRPVSECQCASGMTLYMDEATARVFDAMVSGKYPPLPAWSEWRYQGPTADQRRVWQALRERWAGEVDR